MNNPNTREVPSWDEYFMMIAMTTAFRSKDPRTQVGAIIVNSEKHIVGTGYNGFAPGYPDTPESWERSKKHSRVIHAERNAILHSHGSISGTCLYTTLSPCLECAKSIVASKVSKVLYLTDREVNADSLVFLGECGVTTERLTPTGIFWWDLSNKFLEKTVNSLTLNNMEIKK